MGNDIPVVTLDRFPPDDHMVPSSELGRVSLPLLGLAAADGLMSVKRESCRETLSRSSFFLALDEVGRANRLGTDGLK